MIVIGAVLLCVLLVFGAIFGLAKLFNPSVIAEGYEKPNMEVKLEDDKIISNVYDEEDKETEEKRIYAIHIPEVKHEESNQAIQKFVDQVKSEKAAVTHIDYESSQAFSQYKSYVITATTYGSIDEELNPIEKIKTETMILNFDQDQIIELEDCLRGKAIAKLAKKNNCKESDIQLVKISEKGLTVDILGNTSEYPYDETSFVMNNKNIPTLLTGEKIQVEKREIDPNKPMIAFTFDDGPCPGNTERILAALEKVGGRATFFQLGSLMKAYPDTVKAVIESGSEVASHSSDHDWLTQKSIKDVLADLDSVNDTLFSLTGHDIKLMRPPYGAYNKEIKEAITERVVMWDVDTRDWESRNTQTIIEVTKQYTYDGAIVLFHDIHSSTIPAVEELITYYDGLGYQFVTVSELYEMQESQTTNEQ